MFGNDKKSDTLGIDSGISLAIGLGVGLIAGVAIAALLDPASGRRRRRALVDTAGNIATAPLDAAKSVGSKSGDVYRRTRGRMHDLIARYTEGDVPNRQLIDRIRAEMGHSTNHASAVTVRANQGTVTITGEVPRDDVDDLVRTIEGVRGVREVYNMVEVI